MAAPTTLGLIPGEAIGLVIGGRSAFLGEIISGESGTSELDSEVFISTSRGWVSVGGPGPRGPEGPTGLKGDKGDIGESGGIEVHQQYDQPGTTTIGAIWIKKES